MFDSPIDVIALALTYLIFGTIGYLVSKKLRRPIGLLTWIELILTTLAIVFVMPNSIFIGIGEFKIYISTTLQAIGVGIIIGLATRQLRLRQAPPEA